MANEELTLKVDNRVATITLNRPERMNAFTDEMFNVWLGFLDECQQREDVNVIVITGTGRAFTTGGDIGKFKDRGTPLDSKTRFTDNLQRLPKKLEDIDKPVIAALNGFATGGGLDVALMCDLRLATASAKFAANYARMGLIPGMGGAYYLPRIVGVSKALKMFWTSDFVQAEEALRIGLVDEVYPDDQFAASVQAFAEKLAAAAPLSVRITKRLIYDGLRSDLRTALDLVAANMPVVHASEDHKEAVAAFQEKRAGNFKGR